ncbi:sigma-54-dependent transcriptional regulator [Thalassotalea euphylliae]|uniref:sigma-54-dependent transcriptional regulator n=1 Tax=Thalassotalea euphylliae TaxID=1655234 RepID=UPI00362C33F2
MELPLVVLVDDEQGIVDAIKRCLMRIDANIETFTSPRLALEFIQDNQPALVISDQMMPDIQGTDLLAKVKGWWPSTRCVLLSAYQEFDAVMDGFNQGVIDQFMSKPWQNAELQLVVSEAIGKGQPKSNVSSQHSIIGEHDSMKNLLARIGQAALANVPIFIHGETGTGKELIANACHQLGCKQGGPFVAINCANLSDQLIESQLFGHKKGAFTGAIADQKGLFASGDGGTIFLDEVTTLPLPLQSKLLRVLQERCYAPVGSLDTVPFDAQIVSASSMSLAHAVASGEFREDLYYRLHVVPLTLPPLRERGDDVVLLAEHFLAKFGETLAKSFSGYSPEAMRLLKSHQWPGNVRQLENTIHALAAINLGGEVSAEMLSEVIVDAPTPSTFVPSPQAAAVSLSTVTPAADVYNNSVSSEGGEIQALDQIERQAIEKAIAACNGNVTQAAAMLEVNPSTIYRKMKQWEE